MARILVLTLFTSANALHDDNEGLAAVCADVPAANWSATPREIHGNDWWDFGLNPKPGDIMNELALDMLGKTFSRSADVSEVLQTTTRINGSEPWSATCEWWRAASRLQAIGRIAETKGHDISAGDAYLRAASYFRSSLSRHPNHTDPSMLALATNATRLFERFLELTRHACRSVRVPFEGSSLPAFWCQSNSALALAPVLLWSPGRDTWAEDGLFLAEQGLRRGYRVLLYEGPGMGKVLRLQGLPFRPDWGTVVTTMVDFVLAQEGVDASRLALAGWSFGGFLAGKAATAEPRLKVVVANPGVVDWYNVTLVGFPLPPEQLKWLDGDTVAQQRFDDWVWNFAVKGVPLYEWAVRDAMWKWGQRTPSAWLLDARRYSVVRRKGCDDCNVLPLVRSRVVVVDAEDDTRGQAKMLFNLLKTYSERPGSEVPVPEYTLFTHEEAAQFHDQPGAQALASATVYDKLDEVLCGSMGTVNV